MPNLETEYLHNLGVAYRGRLCGMLEHVGFAFSIKQTNRVPSRKAIAASTISAGRLLHPEPSHADCVQISANGLPEWSARIRGWNDGQNLDLQAYLCPGDEQLLGMTILLL